MIDELCIIGNLSCVGGADTELVDQIKLWLQMGIKCSVIPTEKSRYPINLTHKNLVIEEIRRYSACKGKCVISYCDPNFLIDIEIIRKYAKVILWASCMCFNFKQEMEAHMKGYIDCFIYQTKHQYELCAGNLLRANKNYNIYHITPYFDTANFPFIERRDNIGFGRISRASIDKFESNQFSIYHLANIEGAECIVLGWSDELERQYDSFLQQLLRKKNRITFYKENEISQQEFYKRCGILSMTTKTVENLPRVAMEAMSSGTVLVVDNKYGWKLLVDNGVTGYLCDTESEFIQRIEELSYRPDIRYKLAKNARAKLEAEYSYEKSASSWLNLFNKFTC